MFYIARDADGNIRDLQPSPRGEAQEALPADNPEVLQFIHQGWRRQELSELDRDFVRAIEDTIELLIAKGVILFTELPPKVQEKMLRRKEVRRQMHYSDTYGAAESDIIPI